jgi:two-component sensor histidine kinase
VDIDPYATSSLGLSIVRALVGELGGTLTIGRREDGPGTAVEFSFSR